MFNKFSEFLYIKSSFQPVFDFNLLYSSINSFVDLFKLLLLVTLFAIFLPAPAAFPPKFFAPSPNVVPYPNPVIPPVIGSSEANAPIAAPVALNPALT